jgi:hypothetical protein
LVQYQYRYSPLPVLTFRPHPQAQHFLHKNIKTYLSRPIKGTLEGLAGIEVARGQDIPGHSKKNIVPHIVSIPLLNFPLYVLVVLLVVMLVIVLLS